MESSTVSKSQTATVDSSAIDEDATGSYQHPDGSQELRSEGISDSLEEDLDLGPDAEELADHAIIVEQLWDVLEGYGMVKPNSTRPVPQAKPDPTEDINNDVYAEGYSAENFVAPEFEEESEVADKKLLDELPGMLETIDDLVDVKVHELCEILYHSTNWNEAQPILDTIATFKEEPLAQAVLFETHEKGMYLLPRNEKAATTHLRAIDLEKLAVNAERGNAHAQYHLACMLHGEGELTDALYWFECAANKAHPVAQLRLSQCYRHGHGIPTDAESSVYWCKLSAEQKYAPAINDLGISAKSHMESIELFRAAIAQNFGPAYFNLALCHHYGRSLPASYDNAIRLYRQAADQGCVAAKFNLAVCQFLGQGVMRSISGAVQQFRRGAGLGHAESQNNLGYCQYFGKGLPQDFQKAAECFRLGAAQGNYMSQYNLSCCFESGMGVVANPEAAADLRRKAVEAKGDIEQKRRELGVRCVTEQSSLSLPSIDKTDDIDIGSMITSTSSTPVISHEVLYFARCVDDFEASPVLPNRSKSSEGIHTSASLFSAVNARLLRTVGARMPTKARFERENDPENNLKKNNDDDDATTTDDEISMQSSSTWASEIMTVVGGTEKRVQLSPTRTLEASDEEGDISEDNQDSTVAYHNYFGPDAPKNFYDSFRKMNRLKNHYTVRQLEELRERCAIVKPKTGTPQATYQRNLFPSTHSDSLESESLDLPDKRIATEMQTQGRNMPRFRGARAVFAQRKSADSKGEDLSSQPKEFNFTRTRQPQRLEDSLVVSKNLSPRSVFLQELLFCGADSGKRDMVQLPRSILVVRRDSSVHEINLAHQGVGDDLGVALARSLTRMPQVNSLNIRDNRLTDQSLGPILYAAAHIPTLTKLDLGNNKMDTEASTALANLLQMEGCSLKILSMPHADVDDMECKELMLKLAKNKSVQILDLSHNLIGTKESVNIVMPDFDTGPETIAEFLCDERCSIVMLNLSWNSIQKDSARQLGEALGDVKTLQEIDLSYNAFGDVGGQAIGDMLHRNQSLVKIDLSNNSINHRAAFTIACGLRHNITLCELNLRGNPIGDIGGRSLMQVPIDTGDHITVHLEQCSMTLEDPKFKIDRDTHFPKEPCDEPKKEDGKADGKTKIIYKCDLSKPYRRAIAFEVLRIAAERPGYVVDVAKLNGVEFRLERCTQEREYKDDLLIRQIDDAENHIDEFWERYDLDGSQTIDEIELAELLRDLKMPAFVGSVARIMKVYDVDNSGLLEKVEILEFLEQAKKDIRERTKPRTVMAEVGRTQAFELPHGWDEDGSPNIFEIQLSIQPERDTVVRTTSSMEMQKIMMVARKADNRLLALQLSLGNMRLQVEEAQELIKELRLEVVNPIEVLSMVIRYMSNAQHSQLLVTLELKDNAMRELNISDQLIKAEATMEQDAFEKFKTEKMEQLDKKIAERRRELEGKLTPAFKPLMGMYTGHYVLDLSKDMDRLCMTKLGEQNNLESKMNRFRLRKMDSSQKGNWYCYRNEKFNGEKFQIKTDFFDPLPQKGLIEFDFVSTVRPSSQISKIRPQRFTALFRKLKWIKNETEADIVAKEVEEPYGPVKRMDATGLTAFDQEIAILREDEDTLAYRTDTVGPQKQEMKRQTNLMGGEAQALLSIGSNDARSPNSSGMGSGSDSRKNSTPINGGSSDGNGSTSGVGALPMRKQRSARLRGTVKLVVRKLDAKEALAQLRDEISTKWFSCKQAQWLVSNCPVSLYKELPKDWKIDLVVDIHSRIVDLVYFDTVLETLRPRERAKVIHRLGWLNCFSPTRPDHFYALDLRHREDRVVVKMLVHLGAVEPGVNWVNQTYRQMRSLEDVPGWFLSTVWFNEDGLPTRGNLRVEYYSGEGKGLKNCKPNKYLRALLQTVVLADELPKHQRLIEQATNGGLISRERLIDESLRGNAEPPILWSYDNRNSSSK